MSEKKINSLEARALLRDATLALIRPTLEAEHDVLEIGNGKIAIPVVDANQEDRYVTITISVPTGSRDGDEFDGYAAAQEWQEHLAEKARKKEAAAKLRAEKAAERERKKKEKEAAKEAKRKEKEEA